MKQVPRYTSYPTAPHFHEGVNSRVYDTWLEELNDENGLSFYIHIPFCSQLCWFCGCHTQVINKYSHVSRYLGQLTQEIELVAEKLPPSKLSHIHFGGGSPTALNGEDFSALIQALKDKFAITRNAEIAVEIDPRTVDNDKIAAYASSGVTRVSLGVQDFNKDVQIAINRIQPFEMVQAVVDELRRQKIDALNIDLIYGLPRQTMDSLEDTLTRALLLEPDRISLFGYAHVPWVKKHQKLIAEDELPDNDLRLNMYDMASAFFAQHGYIAIGLDHFAKPDDPLALAFLDGTLRRNFQGYSIDKAETLIGLGVSSISSLPQGYAQNTSNHLFYTQSLKEQKLPIERGVALLEEDKRRREIIMSLMCLLQARVPEEMYRSELEQLQPFFQAGDISYRNNILVIDHEARAKMRLIAAVFDRYLPGTAHLHAQAV